MVVHLKWECAQTGGQQPDVCIDNRYPHWSNNRSSFSAKKIDNIDASKVIKWFLFCFGFLISLSSILMVVWNDGSHNIICWIDSFHFLLLLKLLSILPANNLPVLINEQEYKKNVYVSLPVQVTVTADFQKDFEPGQRR